MFGMGMGRLGLPNRLAALIAAIYNPVTQFAPALPGMWYDPSDYASLSQDSAGTLAVTAATQPAGRMLDKSGRGNTLLQATAASRPITGTQGAIQYLTFDGVDDGLSTGAMTFSADMDCFIALRRATAANFVLGFPVAGDPNTFFGVVVSADAAVADQTSGTPTYAVNGVAVNGGAVGTTRGQLHTAITVSAWVVVEVRNLNLSSVNWSAFAFGNYAGLFALAGDFGGMILAPAGSAATRQSNRQFLGNKVGLTLP